MLRWTTPCDFDYFISSGNWLCAIRGGLHVCLCGFQPPFVGSQGGQLWSCGARYAGLEGALLDDRCSSSWDGDNVIMTNGVCFLTFTKHISRHELTVIHQPTGSSHNYHRSHPRVLWPQRMFCDRRHSRGRMDRHSSLVRLERSENVARYLVFFCFVLFAAITPLSSFDSLGLCHRLRT